MDTEIEAKFLGTNHDEVRKKLQQLGAICEQPMRLMRRVVYVTDNMIGRHGWTRVRDEGDGTVTMSYKQSDNKDIDGTKEIEVVVSNFESAMRILDQFEPTSRSFQESKRESWKLGDIHIDLDIWPWLEPLVEVEAPTLEQVKQMSETLGFDMKDVLSGGVMSAYRRAYPQAGPGDKLSSLDEVRFGAPLPDMFKS